MKKINLLISVGIAVLALAFIGQLVFIGFQEPIATAHASWIFHPNTFDEALAEAKTIVLAEVVSVEKGEDIVMKAEEEPEGEVRTPTQRITLKVITPYSGDVKDGQMLSLFQTGGVVIDETAEEPQEGSEIKVPVVILEGDPLYKAGEQYLLLLVPGPDDMLRTISPEGRYLVSGNTLTPMLENEVTNFVRQNGLKELEASLTKK